MEQGTLEPPPADARTFAAVPRDTACGNGYATIADPRPGDAAQLDGASEAALEAHPKGLALAWRAGPIRAGSPFGIPGRAAPAGGAGPKRGRMTPSGQTVCLCMIVKDEAPVIRRCLDAARPLIDRWLIVDTGSTDGTQAIVREHMAGLPGELHERPWRDFAHNRTEALALARPLGDYSLVVDADDSFAVPAGFALPDLDADSYTVDIHFGAVRYSRPQLVRAALGWRYEGVIHEYLVCEAARTAGHLPIVLIVNQDGARRRDPDTYKRDALVLERALEAETDPFRLARYTFYLAQSYRDAGRGEKALPLYLRRAGMGFWDEEVYCSLLYAGNLMRAAGRPADEVLAVFARASVLRPGRGEALHAAAHLCRAERRFAEGYALSRRGIDLARPDGLFVEAWVYDYGLLDEHAVCAYWTGRDRDCLDACLTALRRGSVPAAEVPRFLDNMRFALDRLPADAGPPGASTRATGEAARPAVPRAFSESWDEARDAYCLWVVSPRGYGHQRAFDGAADVVSRAFSAAGGSAPVVRAPGAWDGRRPIVLGAHLLSDADEAALPAGAVLFNVEQVDVRSGWMGDAYLSRLARHPVLDYSLRNTWALRAAGVGHARHMAVRSMPGDPPADAWSPRDIDVLFYGSMNERRARTIAEIRARGLGVTTLFDVYGAELDAAVARARIVINVHFYDAAIFEALRVCPLLARGACVVSEGDDDDPDTADLRGGLILCARGEIAGRCAELAGDDPARAALGRRGRDAVMRRSQASILAAMFSPPGNLPPGAGPPRPA